MNKNTPLAIELENVIKNPEQAKSSRSLISIKIDSRWKTYIVNTTTEEQVIKLVSTGTKLGVDFLTTPNLQEEGLLLVNPKRELLRV